MEFMALRERYVRILGTSPRAPAKVRMTNGAAGGPRLAPMGRCRGVVLRGGLPKAWRALAAGPVPGYASGIVGQPSALCGFDDGEPVVDPMCRSETLVIEAAEMAIRLTPGQLR